MVALILPALRHAVEPVSAIVQPAKADTITPNASAGSGRVSKTK